MDYTIANVEEAAARAPDAFKIPLRAVRERLKIGWLAKLVFEFEQKPNGCTGERMWVRVDTVDPNLKKKYAGALINTPTAIDSLHPGDVVEFGPEHVADFSAE